ncbi:MAG: guanylate kinase [Lachnospiraceae bacterium]|mgnify:CR=1 FL=1|nr:guanylate kinase [Lachnospiraceae bacterium]MDE6964076.1 guanylate kinase [Lachnospiraceae bacterium]
MGKMIYLMGKSASGKNAVYTHLLENEVLNLKKVVPYTTRPIRAGEVEGTEYHFTDEEGYRKLEDAGMVIEARVYHTYYGPWYYFMVDDGSIDLSHSSYLVIGTLESYQKTAGYFGRDKVVPVLLELDDGVRLKRALEREMKEESPGYEELCRRFLADSVDFSQEKIKEAGIDRRFLNNKLEDCLEEIKEYIIDKMREES